MKKYIKLLIESIFGDVDLGLGDEHDITNKVVDYVDLGLPSGTLWCKCNIGAKKETEIGDYYQWGETTDNLLEYHINDKHEYEFVKYNDNDNLSLLDLIDDIAYELSDGLYKIPNKELCVELIKNTTYQWTNNFNGTNVKGMIFTSKINNEYIFIPAAGMYDIDGKLRNKGDAGLIWTSDTIRENHRSKAFTLSTYIIKGNSAISIVETKFRCESLPVRCVLKN